MSFDLNCIMDGVVKASVVYFLATGAAMNAARLVMNDIDLMIDLIIPTVLIWCSDREYYYVDSNEGNDPICEMNWL